MRKYLALALLLLATPVAAQELGPVNPPYVQGPSSAVSGHIATFSGTTGKLVADGGVPATGSVTSITCNGGLTGGAITTSGTCAADFGTTSGKVLQGAGALGTPSSGDATNLTNIPVNQAKSGAILPAANGGAGTINGALKGNGSGTVSQAACADLSNAVASCSVAPTAYCSASFGPTSTVPGFFGACLTVNTTTVDNIIATTGSAATVPNSLVISVKDCGTSVGACGSPTATIGSVTFSNTTGTTTSGTVSTPSVAAGHYIEFQATGGSMTVYDGTISVAMH